MMRLAARIMLYFAMFSYREDNEVAGHAVASARLPIEQGVVDIHKLKRFLSVSQYQNLPILEKIKSLFIISTGEVFCGSCFHLLHVAGCFHRLCFHKECCRNQYPINSIASCDLKKIAALNLSV